ncbi:MAG: Mur ligase family protein [Bacteroidales bacterium]
MTEQEYKREIDFIFNQFPSYQKVGKIAYKPGIETMLQMDDILGNPHKKFKSVHIAGTNGKGSTSHMIAAAFMRMPIWEKPVVNAMADNQMVAGEKHAAKNDGFVSRQPRIGLYTSPHLVDFRERIKVNGEMVSQQFVYDFIIKYKDVFLKYDASFFEITTAMAFAYFAEQQVDIAVIECGLGGRLDSTNIIEPRLCVITNIGLDHCEYLGYTYAEIASEKAGIIKKEVPVIIGERGEVEQVFVAKAAQEGALIYFAEDLGGGMPNAERCDEAILNAGMGCEEELGVALLRAVDREKMDLQGACQDKNIKTVCRALGVWAEREQWGGHTQEQLPGSNNVEHGKMSWSMSDLVAGIENAAHDTGLHGRWEKLNTSPLIICDTGHNSHGFKILGPQILKQAEQCNRLLMVFGVVADKDLDSIVQYLPNHYGNGKQAYYYFVNAAGTRALPAAELAQKMAEKGFAGEAVKKGNTTESSLAGTVQEGLQRALVEAQADTASAKGNDFIFVGGSTFVVAEILPRYMKEI